MTSSGTIGQTAVDVSQLIEHAFRRAGVSPVEVTIDNIESAKENLFFYLSALANDGIQLWTVEKELVGCLRNKQKYELATGTVDVRGALYRTVVTPSGGTAVSSAGGSASNAFDRDLSTVFTQTSPDGNISYQFTSQTKVGNVGFVCNGSQTYAPIFEYSNDGLSWTEIKSIARQIFADNHWYLYDIDTPVSAYYFRLRETSGGTLDLRQVSFNVIKNEITLGRISFDQYTSLTDKTESGSTPLNFWLDRQINKPVMNVWPTSNSDFVQLVIYKLRQIQDVGELSNTVEIPQRWYDAIVTGLAARMILELPKVDTKRYDLLKQEEKLALHRVQQEERDKSPFTITPNVSCYN